MSNTNSEQERIKRLRDDQIAARDPSIKKHEFQRQSIAKERKAYKKITVKQAWADIPHKWKGLFYGMTSALLAGLVITSLWLSKWAWVVCIFLLLFFMVLGLVIGNAADTRDDIRDNLS